MHGRRQKSEKTCSDISAALDTANLSARHMHLWPTHFLKLLSLQACSTWLLTGVRLNQYMSVQLPLMQCCKVREGGQHEGCAGRWGGGVQKRQGCRATHTTMTAEQEEKQHTEMQNEATGCPACCPLACAKHHHPETTHAQTKNSTHCQHTYTPAGTSPPTSRAQGDWPHQRPPAAQHCPSRHA